MTDADIRERGAEMLESAKTKWLNILAQYNWRTNRNYAAIPNYTERRRHAIFVAFNLGISFTDIAKALGLSRPRVRQIYLKYAK